MCVQERERQISGSPREVAELQQQLQSMESERDPLVEQLEGNQQELESAREEKERSQEQLQCERREKERGQQELVRQTQLCFITILIVLFESIFQQLFNRRELAQAQSANQTQRLELVR